MDRKKAIIVMDTGKNVSPLKVEVLVMRNILIDQVLVVGDGRKYITALINPNWDEIIKIADAKGIPYDKDKLQYGMVNGMNIVVEVGPELYQADFVRQIVAEAVNKANEELADFEQIKKFVVPHRKFLQSYNELTPTSKVKNKVIMVNFAEEIDSLYQ